MKATLALVIGLWSAGFALPAIGQEVAPADANAAGTDTTEQATTEANAGEEFDEQAFSREILGLLSKRGFDEAEKQLDAALEKHPDSSRLQLLHVQSYMALRRAGQHEDAFRHFKAYVQYEMEQTAERGRYPESFGRDLGRLVDFAAQLGGPERATQTLDEFAKAARELEGFNEQIDFAIAAQQALQLAKAGQVDKARSMLEGQLTAASEALRQDQHNAGSILLKATALKNRTALETIVDDGNPEQAWSELLEFLYAQALNNANSAPVVGRFLTEHLSRAAVLARTDPDAAEALLFQVGTFGQDAARATAEGSVEATLPRTLLESRAQQIAALGAQIQKTRKMLALVGADAMYPDNVDGWVNGESLNPDSLKGKVVLLDFFAVWCGPCIATFPHLREWHDEFADQGLQIIGVTNYYQYGWDEAAGRPARQAEIEPEAERAAMEQFAKHYELRHRIAYVTGRELQDFYGVSGIPHAVVIDRHGKVRMFRIGSGDQNAVDLKRAIEESLAESVPAE